MIKDALPKLLDRLADARVLCLGDVMLDRFVQGVVSRISPEAPIPVLSLTSETSMLGGAGNVMRNLATLAGHIAFASVVGDDEAGRSIRALLDAFSNRSECFLIVESNRITTTKTRFVAGASHLLRTDRETRAPITDETSRELLVFVENVVSRYPVILISDYGKGMLTPKVLSGVMALARRHGSKVIVDPKGTDYRRYAGADIITPNRSELSAAAGIELTEEAAYVQAATKIMETCGIDAVVVTRSEEGMSIFTRDAPPNHLPATTHEVYDVSGAGDTAAAILAASLAGGGAVSDCVRLANLGAGIVVGKVGTAIVRPDELARVVDGENEDYSEHKIMSREVLLERLQQWRVRGLRIGFTNGCFDLLHLGHTSLLAKAKSQCDRLVVAVNSDASVRRLKGGARPIQTEKDRVGVLASLASVDAVVLFNEDTPLELIRDVGPDVLFKGADYRTEQVVGADVVVAGGGCVILIDLEPGASTTGIIRRILRQKTE